MKSPEQHVQEHPDSIVFARYAEELIDRGEAEKAVEVLEEGLSAHPRYAAGHSILARALAETGDSGRMFEAYRTAVEIDPQSPRDLAELGKLLLKSDQVGEARSLLWSALQFEPSIPEIIDAYEDAGRMEQSVEDQQTVVMHPSPEEETASQETHEETPSPDEQATLETPVPGESADVDVPEDIAGGEIPETAADVDEMDITAMLSAEEEVDTAGEVQPEDDTPAGERQVETATGGEETTDASARTEDGFAGDTEAAPTLDEAEMLAQLAGEQEKTGTPTGEDLSAEEPERDIPDDFAAEKPSGEEEIAEEPVEETDTIAGELIEEGVVSAEEPLSETPAEETVIPDAAEKDETGTEAAAEKAAPPGSDESDVSAGMEPPQAEDGRTVVSEDRMTGPEMEEEAAYPGLDEEDEDDFLSGLLDEFGGGDDDSGQGESAVAGAEEVEGGIGADLQAGLQPGETPSWPVADEPAEQDMEFPADEEGAASREPEETMQAQDDAATGDMTVDDGEESGVDMDTLAGMYENGQVDERETPETKEPGAEEDGKIFDLDEDVTYDLSQFELLETGDNLPVLSEEERAELMAIEQGYMTQEQLMEQRDEEPLPPEDELTVIGGDKEDGTVGSVEIAQSDDSESSLMGELSTEEIDYLSERETDTESDLERSFAEDEGIDYSDVSGDRDQLPDFEPEEEAADETSGTGYLPVDEVESHEETEMETGESRPHDAEETESGIADEVDMDGVRGMNDDMAEGLKMVEDIINRAPSIDVGGDEDEEPPLSPAPQRSSGDENSLDMLIRDYRMTLDFAGNDMADVPDEFPEDYEETGGSSVRQDMPMEDDGLHGGAEEDREGDVDGNGDVDSDGDENDVTATMAEIYMSQGLLRQARDMYRSLLKKRPGNEKFEKRIDEIETMIIDQRAEENGDGKS